MIRWKCFVPVKYQLPEGKSEGLALKQFYVMDRVGRIISHAGRRTVF